MSYADRDKYGIYQRRSGASSSPGPALMGADTLIGDSVVNRADEDLGDIKEIMLDMHTGQVAYAVLSFGGFLGIGDKLFAVPWGALHLDTVNHRFMLDIDKTRLQTAPGFDSGSWPDMSDVSWAQQVHSFYGSDPQQANVPSMGPAAAASGLVSGGTGNTGGRSASSAGNLQSGSNIGSGVGPGTGTSIPGAKSKKDLGGGDT